ncbi:MAG TPA: universal stress protein [Acidimicrobiales bacterium]
MTKQSEINSSGRAGSDLDQAPPFRRMLVAIDGDSDAARRASDLAGEWAGRHGADTWFVQLTEERRQQRSACETDADPVHTDPATHVVVSGPTLGARNRQLVHGIAEAAAAFEADVIVLGFDRRRLASHRLAPSLREQIIRAVDLPVLVAPTRQPHDSSPHPVLAELDGAEAQRHSKVRRYAHV